ncbi:MAG: TIGR00269 family protein [Candidatus Aenigmarchaeota archaeon]|nr:TIGR00269 family protein [Candidatus Aenigmarchaeota archaeon]
MRCSFCKNKSVYYRRNEGNYYCKNHFIKNIEKKVKRTISQNKLIKNGDRIAIAFSGGKDSSTLLIILNKIFKNNPNIKLFAITIDQGIKLRSNEMLKKTKKLCQQLNIDHYIFSFKDEFGITVDDLKRKMKTGFCGSCGILRRYILNKKARELKATKLATGHNLDDETQTIIMNMIRGDLLRLARVGPMPILSRHKKFVPRIKPLIEIPEEESKLYAKLNKISFTQKKCPYSYDDPLRGNTIKFLNNLEKTSPGIKNSLLQSAYKIKPFIKDKFKQEKIRTCEICGEPSSQKKCRVCELLYSSTFMA